jgi:YcaO-like protein with predicted kinase domain
MAAIHSQSVGLLDGAFDSPVAPDHDRRVEPAKTLQTLKSHFRDLGITRLGEITGLDELGIPIAFAVRPNSFTLSVSLGKGVDRESARASAAMEAAETAIAERRPPTEIRASLRDIESQGETVIDLSRMARCQPQRLDPSAEIDWVEGRDLIAGERMLVPWALAGFDHRLETDSYHDAFEVSSDGLASGNTTAEAVLHGIYELIERDAYALLELLPEDQISRRLRNPLSSGDLQITRLVSSIAHARLRVHLLDMTSDISVPAYMALFAPTRDDDAATSVSAPIYGGCGCHASSRQAIIRALTEAAQARLALVAGARDDFHAKYYTCSEATRRSSIYVSPGSKTPTALDISDHADLGTIGGHIENLISKLRAADVNQIVVVELSPRSSAISVVRVLIPDLQIPLHGHRTQVSRRGLRQLLNVMS